MGQVWHSQRWTTLLSCTQSQTNLDPIGVYTKLLKNQHYASYVYRHVDNWDKYMRTDTYMFNSCPNMIKGNCFSRMHITTFSRLVLPVPDTIVPDTQCVVRSTMPHRCTRELRAHRISNRRCELCKPPVTVLTSFLGLVCCCRWDVQVEILFAVGLCSVQVREC